MKMSRKKLTIGTFLLGSVLMLILALASCRGASSSEKVDKPTDIVAALWNAYQDGNSDMINNLMSDQGQSNAATLCSGAAINCLNSGTNYGRAGELESSTVELIESDENVATVRLRSTWTEKDSELCQDYQLDNTEDGWRVTFFGPPRKCR